MAAADDATMEVPIGNLTVDDGAPTIATPIGESWPAAPEGPQSATAMDTTGPPPEMEVEVVLPPQKRPYGSPLYKVSRDTHDTVDPRGNLMVETGQPTSRDYVVVQNPDFNKWARALVRQDDGYLYYYSNAKFKDNVNTRISVTVVQHHMRRNDFPDVKATEDVNVSYESIQDFVATMRSAAAPTNSKFWFPSTKIRFLQTFAIALHHAHPGQYLALENAAPEPQWVLQHLAPTPGNRMVEGGRQGVQQQEEGSYMSPNWGYWDHSKLMTVYHGTYPSCLPIHHP